MRLGGVIEVRLGEESSIGRPTVGKCRVSTSMIRWCSKLEKEA